MNQNMTQFYTPTPQVVATPTPNTPPSTVQPNPVTFTQEQVNSIVSGRLNSERTKMQTIQNELSNATAEVDSLRQQLTAYQNREVLQTSGIPAHMYDYVAFEANKLAVNGKSFADAVTEFKTAHAELFALPTDIANTQGTVAHTPVANTPVGNVAQQTVPPTQQTPSQVMPAQVSTPQIPQGNPSAPQYNPQVMGNTAQFTTTPQGVPSNQPQVVATGAMFGQVTPSQGTFDADAFIKSMTKLR